MRGALCFRSIQTKQQSIVEQRRMVHAIVVADERVGDAAEFQQTIPIRIVPRQARDLQSQDDAYVRQCHFAGEASEARTFVGTGTG